MKVSELTESEKEYFNMKDKECAEFSDQRNELNKDKKLATLNLIFILGACASLVILGLFLFSGGSWH